MDCTAQREGALKDHLCLITAVDVEFKAAVSVIPDAVLDHRDGFRICRGHSGAGRITVYQAGMSAAGFPEFLTEQLPRENFTALVIAGLAGSLDRSLNRCDAVVYDTCYDLRNLSDFESSNKTPSVRDEFESIPCDPAYSLALYESLSREGISCRIGSGATIDRIVISSEEKMKLGRLSAALAVDMETYQLLAAAGECGLRAAAVRIISDDADQDLPDFNRATDDRGRMRTGKLLAVMAQTPVASANFIRGIGPVTRTLRGILATITSRQLVKPL